MDTVKPYTRADVELVERAIHDVTPPIVDGYVDGRDLLNAEACAVLDALAAAGRLLPADISLLTITGNQRRMSALLIELADVVTRTAELVDPAALTAGPAVTGLATVAQPGTA